MTGLIARLLGRAEPDLSEASRPDAASMAALHAVSFPHGWSEDEFEHLLLDRKVLAHRAMRGRTFCGFIISRLVAGEAEILSVAVSPSSRSRGVGRALLHLHLRRLAGLGAQAVFLEVDEHNATACRLYQRAGFREVGRRPGYYQQGRDKPAAALIMRRDLT